MRFNINFNKNIYDGYSCKDFSLDPIYIYICIYFIFLQGKLPLYEHFEQCSKVLHIN